MTDSDARVYFLTYRALVEDIEGAVVNREVPLNEYQVDVRCFALFIAIQLYNSQSKFASVNNLAKDTWGIKQDNNASASPRSKYTKINYT